MVRQPNFSSRLTIRNTAVTYNLICVKFSHDQTCKYGVTMQRAGDCISSTLIMETAVVSDTSRCNSILKRLISREDSIAFSGSE
jgi:hypothetical protein